jgi:hypothetical protein
MLPGPPAVYRPECRKKGQQLALWVGVEASKGEAKMSIIHQMVPLFIMIQFGVTLIGIVVAMLSSGGKY